MSHLPPLVPRTKEQLGEMVLWGAGSCPKMFVVGSKPCGGWSFAAPVFFADTVKQAMQRVRAWINLPPASSDNEFRAAPSAPGIDETDDTTLFRDLCRHRLMLSPIFSVDECNKLVYHLYYVDKGHPRRSCIRTGPD